jgi:hypothetical protein
LKACAGLRRLEVSKIVHEQSIEVVASLMSLWAVASWTCMKSVGALKMLGECRTRCHLQIWSLLGCHHIRRCEMQARAEGTGVILANLQLDGMQPISFTFMGVLNTCASVVPLGEGKFHKVRLVYIPVSCLLYEWELFFPQGQKCPEIFGTFGKLKRGFQQFLGIAIPGNKFRLYLVNWIQGLVFIW